MAWTIKYYAEWYDSEGLAHRLDFLVDQDVPIPEGNRQELIITSFIVDYPQIDFFGQDVSFGGGAEIKIVSKTPLQYLQDFYLVDPLGMQVRHYIYDEQQVSSYVDGVLDFIGYLDTEQFEDPISDGVNYEITITANNGLSALERLSFYDDNGDKLLGLYSVIDILSFCFKKLKIDFDCFYFGILTWIAPNEGQINYADIPYRGDVFHNVYVLGENYYDEKDVAMNCREVVEAILKIFTAKLYIYNNAIYVLDARTLQKGNFQVKKVSLDGDIDPEFTDISSNITQINRRIEEHSISMLPGKNTVSVKFNKYVYSNPYEIPLNADTVSGYKETSSYYSDDGVLEYKELSYNNAEGFVKLDPGFDASIDLEDSVEFVRRVYAEGSDSDEYFVRIKYIDANDVRGFRLRINTGIFITSSQQFLGFSGQIMWEDPDNYGQERSLQGLAMAKMYILPGTFPIANPQQDTERIDKFAAFGRTSTIDTFDLRKHAWMSDDLFTEIGNIIPDYNGYFPMRFGLLNHPNSGFSTNKWYELQSGQTVFETYWPSEPGTGYKTYAGIVIPLNNKHDVHAFTHVVPATYTIQGGYLSLDIYFPVDNETLLYLFSEPIGGATGYTLRNCNLLIKGLNIHLLEENDLLSEDRYDKFDTVENSDIEFEGTSNINYANELSIDTINGTDTSNFSKGTFFIKVSGSYYDSLGLNERIVRANNFVRGQNNGYLEKLLLNTYLSNLKTSRYSFNVNLEGYFPLFRMFEFELLKRDGVNSRLLPIAMTVDHINYRTSFNLMEIVEEDIIKED